MKLTSSCVSAIAMLHHIPVSKMHVERDISRGKMISQRPAKNCFQVLICHTVQTVPLATLQKLIGWLRFSGHLAYHELALHLLFPKRTHFK